VSVQTTSLPKRGHSINDVIALGVFGKRSNVYALINNGTLKARKVGKRTVILDEDIEAAIATLPVVKPKATAA
jgi:hypothetical protein